MEKPEPVPDYPSTPMSVLPSFWWVRWLAAGLALLMLALIFHTSGRVAVLVQGQARHWMRTTTRVPPHWHWPTEFFGLPAASPPRKATWASPLSHASLVRAFGWHGSGASAQFEPGVILGVLRHRSIVAGVASRVVSTGGNVVNLVAGPYRIRVFPVHSLVSPHSALSPAASIGTTQSTRLTIDVTRSGYPLNPLSADLYGTSWTRP